MKLGSHMTNEQRARISTAKRNPTKETRAKMALAHIGNTNALGHHLSEGAKATISLALKGKPSYARSLTTRVKNSAASMGNTNSRGRHWTEEEKAKISAAHKGILPSDACMAASLKANLGSHHSLEHKAKISASEWKGGRTVWTRKQKAKRRALGFTPLNSWFIGCEGHHINKSDVIYLPRKLHRSITHNQWTGRNMDKINALAGQYLTEDWT